MMMRLMVLAMVRLIVLVIRLVVLVMVRLMVLVIRLVASTRVSSVLTLTLEVIPGPQWTTAFGSIHIQTADLLWATFGCQVVVIQHMHYNEEQP